jgi:hypothetical protein
MSGKIRKGRKSVFREVGLDDDRENDAQQSDDKPSFDENVFSETTRRPSESTPPPVYGRKDSVGAALTRSKSRWLSKLVPEKRPQIKSTATAPAAATGGLHKFSMIALLIAVVLPAVRYNNNGRQKVELSGADAGVIREPIASHTLESRAQSPTDVCKRWAGQSKYCSGALS